MKSVTQKITLMMVLACIVGMAIPALAGGPAQMRGSLQRGTPLLTARSTVSLSAGRGVLHVETGLLRKLTRRQSGAFIKVEGIHFTAGGHYLLLANGRPLISLRASDSGRISDQFSLGLKARGFKTLEPAASRLLSRGMGRLSLIELGHSGADTRSLKHHAKSDEDWNSTPLCGEDSMSFGEVDVSVDQYGESLAVYAMGLDPMGQYTVVADGVSIGPMIPDYFGGFMLLAGNFGDAVPIPEELGSVMDISEVQVVNEAGAIVLSGNFDDPCDDSNSGDNDVVDSGYIEICPAADNNVDGELDWVTYADGLETAFLFADGAPPDATVEIAFDGIQVGAADTDDWGGVFVGFSTDPAYDELLLPDSVLPLSSLSQVDLSSGGAIFATGVAGEECQWPGPPGLVDGDMTDLCPTDASSPASGATGWATWDDGIEEFWVAASGMESGADYALVVDGVDLGVYPADEYGQVLLYFSSNPDGGMRSGSGAGFFDGDGEVLPLPDGIRPVSDIDVVALNSGDQPIVAGSFVNGCDLPNPPELVDEDYTQLCPADENGREGEVGWQIWDDGMENLEVSMSQGDAETNYELVIDGLSLGVFESDEEGMLSLIFSSDPQFPDEIPLPETLQPVSGIDVVEILDASGVTLSSGSFSSPCASVWDYEVDSTGLCNTLGNDPSGIIFWMITTANSTPETQTIYINLWDFEPEMNYSAEIDGITVGLLHPTDWAGDGLVLVIGDGGDIDLPPGLDPVSAIDTIRILDETGAEVAAGSFSNPCSDPDDPADNDGPGILIFNNSVSL